MMVAHVLRGVAVAIAVAGLFDPGMAVERPEAQPLTIAVLDSGEAALGAADRLRGSLGPTFEVRQHIVAANTRDAACPPARACIIVGDKTAPDHVLASGASLVGVVRVGESEKGGPRITAVDAAGAQHPLAAGLLRVHLAGTPTDREARIEVFDGEALVGSAVVPASAAAADVPWWPLTEGPRRLAVSVQAGDAETSVDRIDLGVDVRAATHDVLVYDKRPSWASLFVRRALEADPRFRIRAQSRLGPDLSVTIGEAARLDRAALSDASVVIVGGPDALSAGEVDLLDRFVRVGGGSLILVPDQRLSGPVTRLVPGGTRERLERAPIAVGPLNATELLVVPAGSTWRALEATADGAAVIATRASGEGRIVVAGAMDAWRYRGEQQFGFDRLWRSLVADAAESAGHPLDVVVSPRLSAPGEDVRIEVTYRSMDDRPTETRASAEVVCDDGPAEIVRLWPAGNRRFAGVFTADRPGACQIRASAVLPDRRAAGADFLVSNDVRRADADGARRRIAALAAASGAPVQEAGDEQGLAAAIEGRMSSMLVQTTIHPMRSPRWIVPFVLALAGEWWLRRKRGAR